MYRPFLLLLSVLLELINLPTTLASTIPPSSSIITSSNSTDPDIETIQQLLPAYEHAISLMATQLPNSTTENSNTTFLHSSANWPPAPFSLPSTSFNGWSLHIRSYAPAYLTAPQMHALATICVDQIQHYMRFAHDDTPWPERITAFRPTRRDEYSTYRENVEVAFENGEGGRGAPLTVEAVVKTLNMMVNLVVARNWRELERMVCHDFVAHPVRVGNQQGASQILIFRQVQLRPRTDLRAEE
ncbi:MAG: hypothetical protein Q9228_004487 [Teloschistes exilis]